MYRVFRIHFCIISRPKYSDLVRFMVVQLFLQGLTGNLCHLKLLHAQVKLPYKTPGPLQRRTIITYYMSKVLPLL